MIDSVLRDRSKSELKRALELCILLSEEEKEFWLKNLDTLPDQTIINVLEEINEKNKLIDQYVEAALAEDKDENYLKKLKQDLKKIKNQAFGLEGKADSEGAEKLLEKNLKNL